MSDSASKRSVVVGLDSGSTGVKVAVSDATTGEIVEILPYKRHHNEYETVAREAITALIDRFDVTALNITGSTGEVLQRTWPSTTRIAEISAHAGGARALNPKVEAVLDGGGSEIKFFKIDREGRTYDFAMNPECAAGSGNFLDVQAKRLLLSIDDESDPQKHMPTLGLDAIITKKTVSISGRCSVFAKSDMIHQQQKAVPVSSIVGGLHESLVNNIKATVIQQRLKSFKGLVSFQGGLSQNASLRHCVGMQLGLDSGQLYCDNFAYAAGAVGAALSPERKTFDAADLGRAAEREAGSNVWEKLTDDFVEEKGDVTSPIYELSAEGERLRGFVGIDIGSVSTNVVLIEEESELVISKYYGPTMGRPIEAMKNGLRDMVDEVAAILGVEGTFEEKVAAFEKRIEVCGVATTGSGRFMTGHFLNADCIRNEITAQATGSVRIARPAGLTIDTIFEIGGQDSKYIKLNPDGGVRDYTMNKVCAAGCGSFLEEQADKLAISIKKEFADLALAAGKPADLGDRCTVFIESVMDNLAGFGESRENLVAGLAFSVANNYLNRVVEGRDIEGNVFFQGGTAFNTAVVLAFQKVLKKPVWVTPHNEVAGAVGAACLAKDYVAEMTEKKGSYSSTFSGILDAVNKEYESAERSCRICANRCELQVVKVSDTVKDENGNDKVVKRQIFYGDRCDEMNLNQGRGRTKASNTYIDQRNRILFDVPLVPAKPNGKRVGIPRAMSMWGEHIPLWTTMFTELGFEVVLTGETKKGTVRKGAATSLSDYCVPIRTGHGAIQELLEMEQKLDYIFVPTLVSYQQRNKETNPYACLWTQCFPIALKEAFDFEGHGVQLLDPIAEFSRKPGKMHELIDGLANDLVLPKRVVRKALARGFRVMHHTRHKIRELGQKALKEHGPDNPAFLVIGRPYNSCDPGLSLDIATKLGRIGHEAMPMDFLPLEDLPLVEDQQNMYWKNGERILSAFKFASENEWLIPVWITNFGCGPDSFIRKQARHVMGDRPYLELELDEHTADAGVITRVEAFYDSYRNTLQFVKDRAAAGHVRDTHRHEISGKEVGTGRVMAFCHMDDAAFALAALFRGRGLDAVVMPRTTQASLAIGKRYSSGKECVPYQATLGDKLHFLTSEEKHYQYAPGDDRVFPKDRVIRPEDVVFYDPFAQGPCRFGQYNEGYKRVYEELGLKVNMLCSGAQNNYGDVFKGPWDAVKWAFVAAEGVCAIDTMQRAMRVVRPVAVDPQSVTKLYQDKMGELVEILERPGNTFLTVHNKRAAIKKMMVKAAADFKAVPRDEQKEADVANVGVFGEIYVRSEQFINEFLADRLEEYGIRSYCAPILEWVMYVNYENLWDHKKDENIFYGSPPLNPFKILGKLFHSRKVAEPRFKRWYLPGRVEKMVSLFRDMKGWIDDPHVEDTISAGSNKVPFNIKGELILSWGLAREIQHNPEMHGIVNIGPFGCMPSKVCSTLLHNEEITKPVFDANYDGSMANTRGLKIETFASQVKAYARSMRESGHGPESEHGAGEGKRKVRIKLGKSAVGAKV